MKVVLDTNLFVAAYWNRSSSSARIIQKCLHGGLEAVATEEIARELRMIIRTIRAKREYAEQVERLLKLATFVQPITVEVKTEDREDQKFLECAAAAQADYLITNDDHLLRLKSVGKTRIVKPSEFTREVMD